MERALGYNIENENMEVLYEQGKNPELMLRLMGEQYPPQNPLADPAPVCPIKDQDGVGACQGFSLSSIFGVCYYLATGQIKIFSALGLYLLSQKEDGLFGRDVGSTLSGGMRAAANGICEDQFWPFRDRYDTSIPIVERPFKLTGSKPTNDPQVINAAIDAGLPVQTGVAWNGDMEKEVVTSYNGRTARGGHSRYWFGRLPNGNVRGHGSWGKNFNSDGRNEITPQALNQIVTFRGNTFVIYSPELVYPAPPVVNP